MKVRTEARRNAILQAAAGLFQEMGYERASMNELTKRLGGSKATLYGYFSSKEELFAAVVEAFSTVHLLDAVQELAVPASEPATLEALLTRFAERMLHVLTDDQSGALAVYRMVVAEAGHSDVGKLFHESGPAAAHKAIAGLVEAAMERGELRRADPNVTAQQFLALVTAESNMRVLQRAPQPLAPEEVRQMVARAIAVFFNGVGLR
jgi:AcrR family transcriptional regulator